MRQAIDMGARQHGIPEDRLICNGCDVSTIVLRRSEVPSGWVEVRIGMGVDRVVVRHFCPDCAAERLEIAKM